MSTSHFHFSGDAIDNCLCSSMLVRSEAELLPAIVIDVYFHTCLFNDRSNLFSSGADNCGDFTRLDLDSSILGA